MTIPRLPGLGEELAPVLASLTDTIGSFIKPTAKFDHALRAAFIEKPELMQKFVDVEKANPGTLKAFGFGEGAANLLSGMQESIPAIRERLGQEELQQPETRRVAGQQAATGLTPAQMAGERLQEYMRSGGLDLIKKDPPAARRAIQKLLDLPSDLEVELESGTLRALQASVNVKDLSIEEIIQRVASGKMKITDLSGGLISPETEGGIKTALKMYQDSREAQLRLSLSRMGKSQNDWLARMKMSAAIDRFSSSKTGTLDAHYQYLWGEPGPSGRSAEQSDLTAIKEFDVQSQSEERTKQLQSIYKTIEPLYKSVMEPKKGTPKATESRFQYVVGQINQVLESNNSEWRAFYDAGKKKFAGLDFLAFDQPTILLRNQEGFITPDLSAITSEIPGKTTVKAPPDPRIMAKVGALMSVDESARKLEMERLYNADPSPDKATYSEILRGLRDRGINTAGYER